ncbi:MAG: hypothetical protein ACJA2S_005069 [Cyclobacteriaceae bacterium]|jgi:hypothetical protein
MVIENYKVIVTRLLYLIPLTIFVFGLITNSGNLNTNSSLGVEYLYLFSIPIFIFLYQTIRNSIIGWGLVMILYISYLIIWIFSLIDAYKLVGAKHELDQYLSWWGFVLIYLVLGFIYCRFRPKKLII